MSPSRSWGLFYWRVALGSLEGIPVLRTAENIPPRYPVTPKQPLSVTRKTANGVMLRLCGLSLVSGR